MRARTHIHTHTHTHIYIHSYFFLSLYTGNIVVLSLFSYSSAILLLLFSGKCDSSDFKSGDKCYKKTKYDGSESNKVDWYDGQTYCSKNDIQCDIAYSYLNNNSEIKKIFDLFTGRPDPVQLWLGVRRRIWSWETGNTLHLTYCKIYFSFIYITVSVIELISS